MRCHSGLRPKLGVVRGKSLTAGLHAVEASGVSASSPSAFRVAALQNLCGLGSGCCMGIRRIGLLRCRQSFECWI